MGYREAVVGLTSAALAEGAEPDEEAVDGLLDRSEALRLALAEHLSDAETDVRQLAALQLEAAATVDVHTANRLAATSDGAGFEAALADAELAELSAILNTPTEQGIATLDPPAYPAQAADAPPQATLTSAMTTAVDAIARDAVETAAKTVGTLSGVAAAELAQAVAAKLGQRYAEALDTVTSWLKRKALAFLLRATEKLLAVFRVDEDAACTKVRGWIDGLTLETVEDFVTERLYAVTELKTTFGARITADTGLSAEKAKAGSDELAALAAHWSRRTSVIATLAGLIGAAKDWVFDLAPPWTETAFVATAVTATGYVILAGGDYLDWSESDGVLDRVEGVGTIVTRATS